MGNKYAPDFCLFWVYIQRLLGYSTHRVFCVTGGIVGNHKGAQNESVGRLGTY